MEKIEDHHIPQEGRHGYPWQLETNSTDEYIGQTVRLLRRSQASGCDSTGQPTRTGTERILPDRRMLGTYLGRHSGFKPFVSAASTLKEMELDLEKVDASVLAPWQKFEATNTFILSHLSYLLKSGYVLKRRPQTTSMIK